METKVGYKRIVVALFFILATVMLQVLAVKAQQENPVCEEHLGHPCTPGVRECCANTGRQCVSAPSLNGFRCSDILSFVSVSVCNLISCWVVRILGRWDLSTVSMILPQNIIGAIKAIKIFPVKTDSTVYSHASGESFNATAMYRQKWLSNNAITSASVVWDKIWSSTIPPRVKIFFWQAFNETAIHILKVCPRAKELQDFLNPQPVTQTYPSENG
uniref:Reverse transcriptase zinc-binding domain-containing protein n=1 Tax=Chenopodium quinoa TaxID=63459 RepID=A0A803N6F5_CHEQI